MYKRQGKDTVFRSFAFTNVIGNIVIFLPFGVYLALFNPDKRLFKNVLFVFLFSLSVEILQYTLKLGIGDIDDVILNCLGGALGIAAYKILLSIFKDADKVRHLIEILAQMCIRDSLKRVRFCPYSRCPVPNTTIP